MAARDRRGGNKNRTGGIKKTKKKVKKVARVEKQKERVKKRDVAKRSQATSNSVFERAEVGLRETGQPVGTAIVLAHGAGGSSSHASMRAWSERMMSHCDEVRMFDFPRPFNRMAKLVEAHCAAIRAAYDAGHRRIILVGCSMGARVALHMLTGLPGADGAPVPTLDPELRASIVCQVALSTA